MSVLSTLEYVFPPPRYLTMPNVGVDISDTSLKYVQFQKRKSRDSDLRLEQWGDIDVPEGVVNRGDVADVAKLGKVLEEAREKTGAAYVRVSLPEERAYIFETTVKRDTPFKEIRGLLEFKLEENVPLPPREAFFDYQIVDTDTKDFTVVVAVYARETILSYYEACQRAELMPLSFEVEAQAISRAVVPRDTKGTTMVVDFGKTRTGIGIVHNGVLLYTSTIDIGGLSLSSAMREVLGDVSESELTDIKNTRGLVDTVENEKVAVALRTEVANIKNELQTRIQYWHTREVDKRERSIAKIILCGGSSNLRGLPEYLRRELSIPAVRASVWQNAFSIENYVPPITKRYSFGYTTAVGLALTDFV